MRNVFPAMGLLVLAACGDSGSGDTAPPQPELTQNAAPTVAADGGALTVGEWTIGEDAAGAHAMFGEANSEPRLVFACDSATHVLSMSRAGSEAGAYVVEAGGQAARVDMATAGAEMPEVSAAIAPGAPVFAAATDPANTLSITSPGGDTIRMPGAPGLRRVLEACS